MSQKCAPLDFECWLATERREMFYANLDQCWHLIQCRHWILHTNYTYKKIPIKAGQRCTSCCATYERQ